MKRAIFSLLIGLLMAGQAIAAPLWIERQFIPDKALVDPIFLTHAEEPASIRYEDWDAFLKQHLTRDAYGVARLSYGDVTEETKLTLVKFISELEATDITALTQPQQLAFWINLYNAATVRLILDNYPVKSIRKIDSPWDIHVVSVNGVSLTLNQIEHGIIRPVFDDPRIHYAVNCASIGCPNLADVPYTEAELNKMLDAAARDYVNHPRGVSVDEDGDVTVSKIYGWYKEDFGKKDAAILDHIRQYANPDLLKALEGVSKIDDYDYDWDLNETP